MKKRASVSQKKKGPSKRLVKSMVIPPPTTWTGAASDSISKRLSSWVCDPQGVCKPAQDQPFTNNMPWRIFRIMSEFVEGFEFLSRVHQSVTFFGSARAPSSSYYYQLAQNLGRLCAENGYTVITGGGPGIMEAGNRGASDGGGESIGLNISLPMEQRVNPYVKKSMGFHYFFTRKVMLAASAQAYVYFPGGFGTLDELFEVVTLIQTGKMTSDVPVILMGSEFWQPMLNWVYDQVWSENRFIDLRDLDMFHLVDSPEEAFKIIKKTQQRIL